MSPDNPIQDAAAGAAKGTLDWTVEKIKSYATRLLNRDIAFVEDFETLHLIKGLRKSAGWKLYSQYLRDRRLRILTQMGMTLKSIEDDSEKLQNLRDKILDNYGEKGLHVAQVAQNGLLFPLIAALSEERTAPTDVTDSIEDLLNQVDNRVEFIRTNEDTVKKIRHLEMRMIAQNPQMFILFGSGAAKEAATRIARGLAKKMESYRLYAFEEGKRRVFVFVRKRGWG